MMKPKTIKSQENAYQTARSAFESGKIGDASREDLMKHLVAIANNATGDDAIQARDIVRH